MEVSETKGWVEDLTPVYSQNSSSYLLILPQPQDGHGNYKHLTLVDESGQNVSLSSGTRVVTSILGWNSATNKA